MSLSYWNSASERRELQALATTTSLLYACDSQSSDSEASDVEDDPQISVPLLLTLGTLAKHVQVYQPIQDSTIKFGLTMHIADFNESQCVLHFRFRKQHLMELATALWPRLVLKGTYDCITCENRYKCPFETALLILLFRLTRPRRLRPEMEEMFGMRKSHLSAILCTIVDAMYTLAIKYLRDPLLFKDRMPLYAQTIFDKNGILKNLWGFVDGTLRKTIRPTYFQKQAYSGHKRCHGLKFQSVVTPDGLIALLWGPMNGNRHDSHMLRQSKLLQQLQNMMPVNGITYALYGDPAYPQSQYLFGGFWDPRPGSIEALWNRLMSKVREVVE